MTTISISESLRNDEIFLQPLLLRNPNRSLILRDDKDLATQTLGYEGYFCFLITPKIEINAINLKTCALFIKKSSQIFGLNQSNPNLPLNSKILSSEFAFLTCLGMGNHHI